MFFVWIESIITFQHLFSHILHHSDSIYYIFIVHLGHKMSQNMDQNVEKIYQAIRPKKFSKQKECKLVICYGISWKQNCRYSCYWNTHNQRCAHSKLGLQVKSHAPTFTQLTKMLFVLVYILKDITMHKQTKQLIF